MNSPAINVCRRRWLLICTIAFKCQTRKIYYSNVEVLENSNLGES